MTWKFVVYLRDYCANGTLAGLSYISNRNLHFTERIFWLICVVLSALGSYHLISQFEKDFESKAVSIVYESLPHNPKVKFPSVSVCDVYDKYDIGADIEAFVQSLGTGLDEDYNFDVETHVAFLIYPYVYHEGTIKARCVPYEDCAACAKCPAKDYRALLNQFGVNCSSFFVSCSLSDKRFDCCNYFRPLITPFGKCFMLNSIQNNHARSRHWLDAVVDPTTDRAVMKLVTKRPMQVSMLNEEDIPHTVLPGISVSITEPGQHKTFQIYVENMVNDPDVREVSPAYRKCRFADEVLSHSAYKSYSFSTCLADCIRVHQVRVCNCTLYTLMPLRHATIPDCDYEGYLCLEAASMIKPDAKALLPWANNNFSCECLPSCTENDLNAVYESNSEFNESTTTRSITIAMPILPTERYRRQALRTRLDVVVTIGGIMGLFMGASILSAIEFLYFFTLRVYNNVSAERNRRLAHTSARTGDSII